jgi:CDP-diacylglycerol--glycerol-3-phosphate 3-phosphatidyltransferase
VSAAPAGPPPLLNIANVLTGLRLLLVPVFLVLLMHGDGTDDGWRLGAFAVFALAAVTDRFDGELARRRGLVTAFGTIADPIADKALIGAALIGLSLLGQLPWWVTVVIMGREVGITLLRFFVLRHGIIPASRGGKAKTLVQTVAIGLFVLPLEALPQLTGPADALRWVILAVALVLTVVTGFDYVLRAMRLRSAAGATVRDTSS